MRQIPQVARLLIRESERCILHPYLDIANIPTIGWGAIYGPTGARVSLSDQPITQDMADWLWTRDVNIAGRAIERLLPNCPLTDNQYAALLDFTFNLGSGVLQRSSVRQAILRLAYEDVPERLLLYRMANGQPSRGLLARRTKEARLWNLSTA